MSTPTDERTAHPVDLEDAEIVDLFGPTIAFLTPPVEGAPCVMRGTIPPAGIVPLHSHADPETFMMLDGAVEGLVVTPDGHRWVAVRPGEVFHVPGHAPHAWRNPSQVTATMNIVSTARMGAFFREVGTPVTATDGRPSPPSDDDFRRFHETAERYGYWNATPEENARVGLVIPAQTP